MFPSRLRWRVLAGAALVLVPGAWLLASDPATAEPELVGTVEQGDFVVTVTTSGELRAQKFVEITAPPDARLAEAYQMKILSIVPEGTTVKEGDVVAELDRSTLASKIQEFTLALQKAEAVYEQAMLDSTLNLSKAREDMRSMELALEEKKIAKDQARYEAPSVQRQAEIDLERAVRALAQAKLDYKTKTEQAQAKMREVGADLERQRGKLAVVQQVMQQFTIRAPAPGMVIYVKEWNGKKRTTGSQVSAWDPGVATLPDLTEMESITYVNEIDVRKIAVGQPATITLDSDPDKRLVGRVTAVANMGEQRPNTDAKVFEVKVIVVGADTTLRPGMTTGNAIETLRIPNALFVSLEAINSENGVPHVFRQVGGSVVKQEVETGAANDDEVVILRGLEEGDRVLLVPPQNAAELDLVRLPGSKAGMDTTAAPKPVDSIPLADSAAVETLRDTSAPKLLPAPQPAAAAPARTQG
ncbi:MAG TPA: efflux RND transporter periplasmic adaptor subunit [Gemmatimonadales bacterium]|nr:efflux RND transporter periplasmic adaptor subunit [Gemmatimonadales bacterium]